MRRAIALSLMTMFSWMLVVPLFAPDANEHLPACCRRNGKHHCMMHMMERHSGEQIGFRSVEERCPCCPALTCAVHSPIFKTESGERSFADVVPLPLMAQQTEALYCISSFCSHPKRGPPLA